MKELSVTVAHLDAFDLVTAGGLRQFRMRCQKKHRIRLLLLLLFTEHLIYKKNTVLNELLAM